MNERIYDDLKQLCEAPGCANQDGIREVATQLLRPLTDRVWTDAMGNVLAVRQGSDATAPTVMLEAHMDEIGFLVTGIDDNGFVRVASAGGIDTRVLATQGVTVYGDRPYEGVFCSVPPHLSKDDEKTISSVEERGVDVGLSHEEAVKHIPLGSRVTFSSPFCRLMGDTVSGKAMDNRAGMAAILHALRKVPSSSMTVAVAFAVQEEIGARGAKVATAVLRPDSAIALDVSFAKVPGENERECAVAGKGTMIGISPILNASMTSRLFSLADERHIPHQTEVMSSATGTDADEISLVGEGVPTALISIPLKFMHTPTESVCIRDIEATGDLLAAWLEKGGIA